MELTNYNNIATEFSATRNRPWADFDFFLSYLKPNQKILDLGCGNGRLAAYLLKKINLKPENYLGVDASASLIDEARAAYPEFTFAVGDMRTWQSDQKFDAIFLISSFCHIPRAEQIATLENIKQSLKPGAFLFMINWNLWNLHNKKSVWRTGQWLGALFGRRWVKTFWGQERRELDYYAFTKIELAETLRATGFEILECEYLKNGRVGGWLSGENIAIFGKE